jgi:hypothetical protein
MAEIRVLDFDRARAERRKPTVLKAFGQSLEVPSSAPLGFVFMVNKLNTDKGADYTPDVDEMEELLVHAIGAETFSVLMGNKLEQEDMEQIVAMLMDAWFGDDDEGEAGAPVQGAGSST